MPFSGPTVSLKANSAELIWQGRPWVGVEAVDFIDRPADPGVVVRIETDLGQTVDFGLWNPQSPVRVQLLGLGTQWPDGWPSDRLPPGFWRGRVSRARRNRGRIGLPSSDTNAFRLFNAEGDGLPGFALDLFDGFALLAPTSAAAYAYLDDVRDAIMEVIQPSALTLLGWQPDGSAEGGAYAVRELAGFAPPVVEFLERGVTFAIEPHMLNRYTHFTDRREMRLRFGKLATGRNVLDAFSGTGGFGLQAARHGAARVVCLDSSEAALSAVGRNAELNHFADRVLTRHAPTETYLAYAFEKERTFDLVVVDPPPLAEEGVGRKALVKRWERLFAQVARVLVPGGLVYAISSDSRVGAAEMHEAAGLTGAACGRIADVLGDALGTADHPTQTAWPEGRNLCATLLSFR